MIRRVAWIGIAIVAVGCAAYEPTREERQVLARCGGCELYSSEYFEAEAELREEKDEVLQKAYRLEAKRKREREAALPPPAAFIEMGGDPSPAGDDQWRVLPWLVCRVEGTKWVTSHQETSVDDDNGRFRPYETHVGVVTELHTSDRYGRTEALLLHIGREWMKPTGWGELYFWVVPTRLANGCYRFEGREGIVWRASDRSDSLLPGRSSEEVSAEAVFDYCPSRPEMSGGEAQTWHSKLWNIGGYFMSEANVIFEDCRLADQTAETPRLPDSNRYTYTAPGRYTYTVRGRVIEVEDE